MRELHSSNPWYSSSHVGRNAVVGRDFEGVNLIGYLQDESGWGAAARGYARAIQSLHLPTAFSDLSVLSSNRSEDWMLGEFDVAHPYKVNLVCVDAAQHFAILSHIGVELFEGRYNIGAWAWELPRFPGGWYDRFAYYDEIWVTTSFVANTLAPISPVPVVVIPPVLTPTAQASRDDGRRRLALREEEHVYLFVFDFHSHMARKNPLAVIEAFKLAFSPTEAVRLVIKCVNEGSDPAGFAEMESRAHGYPIDIHAGYWSSQKLRDLMDACDAYVSLHRSEGTGLTITDAMALGKPVIATSWSGNMDFMDVSNSFLVRYDLVELQHNVGPYRAGEVWADPSVEHAAEQMRTVFDDREEAALRGRAARLEIETNYSEVKVAELVGQRLGVISELDRLPEFRREIRDFYSSYLRLVGRIAEVAGRVIPEDSVVSVISKGDNGLVQMGEELHAWHFPRNEEGVYLGYHPADSTEAIARLEVSRRDGAGYLLIPGTAFWWLDHYSGFRDHLDAHYRRVWEDRSCIIFDLSPADSG
jgi:glycosyltransferase involved in cell wall biosynthesis